MISWKYIHLDFAKWYKNETYQQYWKKGSLTYQDAQILIPVGFEPKDYDKVKQWKGHNFTSQQTQSWIKAGLTKNDYEFAAYLRWKNYTPTTAFQEKSYAQHWLERKYPPEQRKTIKELDIRDTDIDSGLEYLPDSLVWFYCSANERKEAKCQTIYNLLANEEKEKNFPQKLQDYKQKKRQFIHPRKVDNNPQEKSPLILQWEGVDIDNNSCEVFSVVAGSKEETLSFSPTFFANLTYQSSFQKDKIYKLTYTGELKQNPYKVIQGTTGGNFAIEDITNTQFIKEIWEEKEQAKEKITLLEKQQEQDRKKITAFEKQLQVKEAENNLLHQQLKQIQKQNISEQIKTKQKEITQLEQQLNNLTFSDALQESEQQALQVQPTYGLPSSSEK
ncbi:MAG: hypothetical protein MRECE_47c004 [Mycoplasmataceae bacterium CE_OT135]|nr:MAG: hypothetical protein MRECE_47c004 [Mycoplasmataceae bacterium CE_OT135]